jgi:CubicO group peptidase (beta-lactamase class C family)
MTAPWLLVALLTVALGVGWAGYRLLHRRGRWVAASAAVLLGLGSAAGGVQAWAVARQDSSSVARAIAWRGADADDWQRFAALPVAAGPQTLELHPVGDRPGEIPTEVAVPGAGREDLDALLERTATTAFLVLRGDDLLAERYLGTGSRGATETSFSVAKSLLSTLVGIAIKRGEIGGLDDAVTDYVPELADRDPRFARITLRHLITMSSGLRYEERGLPWTDDATTYYAPDLRSAALSVEIDEPPGRRFHYDNYNPLLMGLVLERAVGMPVADYTSTVLWQPLGAEADASWSADSSEHGFPKMESGFNARAIDFARIGYLLAHDGRVGDRQVVPPDWVAEATALDTGTDPAEHYQYWWWVDTERPGRFYAHGNLGQFIYVDPQSDVVVVRMGDEYGIEDWPAVLRDVADHVGDARPGG